MDEIVIRKKLLMGLNSKSDKKRCCFFGLYRTGVLV